MLKKEIYWSRFADDFEKRNNYVIGDDMTVVLDEVAKQENLKNTLELACGNGTYSKVLIKNAEKLLATDFSDEMVKVTKNRLDYLENIEVKKADAFNLDMDESTFDTIFMANLLHIVPNPEDIVSEAKRVLKKRGKIIVVDFTMEGMSFLSRLLMIFRYLKTYGKPPVKAKALGINGIKEMLKNENFEIEEVKLIGNKNKAAFVTAISN